MWFLVQLIIATVIYRALGDQVDSSYVVDIAPLISGGSTSEVTSARLQLDAALRENGLVIITGHGISQDRIRSTFDAAYRLFSLDLNSKSAASIVNDESSFGRGYLGFGDESGLSSHFEPKEGYSYGSSIVGKQKSLLNIKNKWPVGLADTDISILEQLYQDEVGIAKTILGSLSSLFTCTTPAEEGTTTRGSLADVAEGGELISLMRMFHYFNQQSRTVQDHLERLRQAHHKNNNTTAPAYSESSNNEDSAGPAESESESENEVAAASMLGSSPHTDWGFLTVILADEVGGLQFLPKARSASASRGSGGGIPEDSWVDVPYVPGSLIINGGDYLKLISGGVYHSPVHRVLSPGAKAKTGKTQSQPQPQQHQQQPLPQHQQQQQKQQQRIQEDSNSSNADRHVDRYSFVFFFYPAHSSPVSASVLAHCTHHSRSQSHLHTSSPSDNIESASTSASTSGRGSAEAEVSPVAGAASTELHPEEPESLLPYNTLLQMDSLGGATTLGLSAAQTGADDPSAGAGANIPDSHLPPPFGDYVIMKWKGVYRKDV